MTHDEIDRLIAMLEPNAEENTVLYVRSQFIKQLPRTTREYVPPRRDDASAPDCLDRSEPQSVDIFEEWSPNDPRNW